MKKNVALVGIGRWGRHLARNLYQIGVLHTLCDTQEELLKQFENEMNGVSTTTHFTSLLQNPHIERIVIAAPAPLHFSLAKQALLAGKDLFVEKPLTLNSKEAQELVLLAKNAKRILMTGHLLHYHPCLRTLQEMVREGTLGEIRSIQTSRLSFGPIRTGEGVLWDLGPHDVSLVLSMINSSLIDQKCMTTYGKDGKTVESAMLHLFFEGDVKSTIHVSCVHPFKEQRLVVTGTRGAAVFEDTKPWGEKLTLHRKRVEWGNPTTTHDEGIELVEVASKEPLREECLHFLECCEKRTTPRTDGMEALRVVQILESASEATI